MMNEEMEQFESRLRRQPLRELPAAWRAEVLSAALLASRPTPRASFFTTFHHQLATLLWPHPKAWAGLAAVWILIFALNFSLRESSPRMAEKSAPPSPAMMMQLRKQQWMLAKLIGPRETQDADRPRFFAPRPRSERVELLTT